jgi:hypothetical protein
MNGNPRCVECNGRGGSFRHGRWLPCDCVKPRKDVLKLQRQYNQTEGHEYIPITERARRKRDGG